MWRDEDAGGGDAAVEVETLTCWTHCERLCLQNEASHLRRWIPGQIVESKTQLTNTTGTEL